jgi:hypothetical protein
MAETDEGQGSGWFFIRRFDLSTHALYPICFSAIAKSRKAPGRFRHLVTSLIGEISFSISIGAEVSEERPRVSRIGFSGISRRAENIVHRLLPRFSFED